MARATLGATIDGLADLARANARVRAAIKQAQADAMRAEAEALLADSQLLVPVETGALKASGRVEDVRLAGDSSDFVVAYGGEGIDYAIRQHEDLTLHHPQGGSAKFLERPALERLKGLEARVGKRVADAIDRVT